MRAFLLAWLVCLSCGNKTALPRNSFDAAVETVARGDAEPNDGAEPEGRLEAPGLTEVGGATGAGGTPGTGGATAMGGATGGDSGGDGGTCPRVAVDAPHAAEAYAAFVGLDSTATVQATELSVPGLWDEMQAQAFNVKTQYPASSTSTECSLLYQACAVTLLTDDCSWFGPIASGVVRQGAFYYSWPSGSGMFRTIFSKLTTEGGALARTDSDDYFNQGYGPPALVLALEAEELRVYRPTGSRAKFNEWQGGKLLGTLRDFGNRLAIVDDSGQELPAILP